MDQYIKKILTARVYDVSRETSLELAPNLMAATGNEVLLKREDSQSVFSFKCRGAYNRIYHLKQQYPDTLGVVCASAGNHAQGVALSASKLGLVSKIVMPETTPRIKVDAVRALGGEAILFGDAYDEAFAHACELTAETGFPFIHPFNDPDTIAGQGTVGVEICRQNPGSLDAVFLPIGGGGLAAGVSLLVKYLKPETRIIGVEPVDAASMKASIEAGRPVSLREVGIFADGVAVKSPGDETFRICRDTVDEIVTITVDEMCAAIRDVFDDTRTLMEPAGALSVAGLKKYSSEKGIRGQRFIAITTGANVNFDRMRHIAERAEIGENREALLAVKIPEQPGSFRNFCEMLGRRSITEFNYRRAASDIAVVFVGVQLSSGYSERQQIIQQLLDSGYEVEDLTENELAKQHVRHMVGGRASSGQMVDSQRERLYRFQFPERPGALGTFLNSMGPNWNITLFHYRNHGAAYGRVLIAMQIPASDNKGFQQFLDTLGYRYWCEDDNPAYQTFLR
ncbi:PLP-dependent threonine dehydratase [Chromatiales bacterium (ex Bugula neritina AB1)]|nr:PLP-dependent threonine dehydratase [Chromatiales bacterium (ex Bugula neritina AB1)]